MRQDNVVGDFYEDELDATDSPVKAYLKETTATPSKDYHDEEVLNTVA